MPGGPSSRCSKLTFKYVDLDVATAPDTTRINDRKLPRSLLINLGFNVAF